MSQQRVTTRHVEMFQEYRRELAYRFPPTTPALTFSEWFRDIFGHPPATSFAEDEP
jgi:hypothetical protein